MHLSEQERLQYGNDGFVLVNDVFSQQEIAALKQQIPPELAVAGPRVVMENDGSTVRAIHGSHATNQHFNRLARHPRLVRPAEQVLGGAVYVHQFKINVKAAFVGDIWKWHQDFIFWQKQDGMREPRAINAMVFLDDVTEFNGPLLLVPGSQHLGMIDVADQSDSNNGDWTKSFSADLKYTIPRKTLADLMGRSGIVAPKGGAGSVLFTHCNLVHGSAPNMSAFDRVLAIVTYNRVDNALLPVDGPRPEFLVSRTFDPITVCGDDALSAGATSAVTDR